MTGFVGFLRRPEKIAVLKFLARVCVGLFRRGTYNPGLSAPA
jgi:hypothetical protein